MKKHVIAVSLMVGLGLAAQVVAAAESGAGCGLGKMIMEGKSGKGANIAASVINDILIPRTLFMTTAATMGEAMLGCDPSQTVMKERQEQEFVATNLDNLSRDMAQGGGDHLEALAAIMGIDKADRPAFYSISQSQFGKMDLAALGDAHRILASLNAAMLSHPTLSKYSH
ncbi:MAG TPA: DUF3015 domain-containing protein [Gammaproteobacteria bacterium]|nr:DUF3015 domain-containing protein [Gammaproteobacteria bacterium]